ncbi:MAG: phosphohydrolase [Candidatus Omnitrophota bacterium]
MSDKCPGNDGRNVRVEAIKCPACGYSAEIFSDEVRVRCPGCKGLICRVRLPACVDWCKSARRCVGEEKWRQLKGG